MKRLLHVLAFLALALNAHADPLRVFIRGGKKTHGPNAHEHERFLNDWKKLLAERGLKTDGGMDFPSAEQLAQADVLVMYAQDSGNITPEQRPALETFIKRGGGIVVIHTASVANKPETSPYWKAIIGGSWVQGKTKWKEGPMDLYYTENQYIGGGHPITKGASNFHLDDEIYYDMDLSPDIRVLATSYTPNVKEGKKPAEGGKAHIYDIQPQMWVYEKTADGGTQPYRAFVSIPGHLYDTFEMPNYRAILLRGIAWAGKRANLDEFCKKDEIEALTYPAGGPRRPADTLKALEVHPDFTIKLVASEPLINKPMNFDWDPAGRLWVAETPEYPNGRRGMRPDYRGKEWKDHGGIDPAPGVQERAGQDKISILTDTDGDGVMDKKDIFYEGLDLVTGLVFHKDGVIVTQAPDILWLRDTDGDGKADKVEKLYTGLGTGDTHAVINNPRWGWDGWIYATHGYSAGDVTSADGSKKFGRIGSGVVRFKPDGSAFEQYSSKGGNTWGLEITGDNRVMWTQPTSGQLLMHTVLPESVLARGKIGNTTSFKVVEPSLKTFPAMSWEQLAYVQIDWVGSFTAAAGCVIYDGGAWPEEYNGDYFCTEPTINIIHHARLTPEGSSFTFHKLPGREETEFIRSKDMWWRPIEVRVGPDGAVYVGDFYNQAVIHNDTRGPDHNKVNAAVRPDRDHYFGRIWKIEHKQAKKLVVPNLAKVGSDELWKQFSNPNRAVRMTASRMMVEAGENGGAEVRKNMAFNLGQALRTDAAKMFPDAQIAAMWTLQRLGDLPIGAAEAVVSSADAAVRRNVALLAEVASSSSSEMSRARFGTILPPLLGDADAAVRVAALRAVATGDLADEAARALIAAWPKFDDDFQRSAAVGAASRNPAAVIAAALDAVSGRVGVPPAGSGVPPERTSDAGNAAGVAPGAKDRSGRMPEPAGGTPTLPEASSLVPLVSAVTQNISGPADAANLVIVVANSPADANALKRSILDSLASLKEAPPMTPELSAALTKLLASGASGSALPLAAKWDKTGALKGKVTELTNKLLSSFAELDGDDARLSVAQTLIGLRGSDPRILPAVMAQLKVGKPSFQRALIAALGETDDASVGTALAAGYGALPADVQPAAFDAVLKRADWTNAFLDAVKAKQVDPMTLGPAAAYRLRTHPDKTVARRASEMLEQLNPMAKAKKETIAKLTAEAEKPGDPAKGKALFTTTCAVCHKFGDFGADIGPGLTGMGAHGAGELLSAIVDPNAEVDPSFVAWNIETKDGQFVSGVIASENPASVTLKSLAGVQEVKTANIKSRVNTGRSLMPEGFEGLGGETLRDIIAYMQSVDGGKFRTVDLRDAFTATTALGLYYSQEAKNDSLFFTRMGNVQVGGVPFTIVSPEKAVAGANVIVLKGGPAKSYARTLPQRVEANLGGFKANRLHFLGGVGGWAARGPEQGEPVLKVTVHYTDGQTEELLAHDGVEFADYNGNFDVPGSKAANDLVKKGQLRWFTKALKRTEPIASLALESFGGRVAPTLVAITAELADPNAPPVAAVAAAPARKEPADFKPQFSDPVPEPPATASGTRALLVGGGSSHDFDKWFGAADKTTLSALKPAWLEYTHNANGTPAILDHVDVLVWSANQLVSSETCAALMKFAAAGKGLIPMHPGTWYAWKNFPAWNKEIIGGGTNGHDKFGEFEVEIVNDKHPVTAGLPKKFKITDELYNFIPDPAGTPIEVLAQATSPITGKTFPQVWIVKHPKARIICNTLGHDGKAHELPEYQTLLKNSFQWAAGK
ncbi:MAG: hypothetical protein QOE70_3473 [Chthoniobacter sp.]|jgi:putative membrane-bound dehydrogenase-like protein|nr:hypothetical protein [Chthoniobacter sp.]